MNVPLSSSRRAAVAALAILFLLAPAVACKPRGAPTAGQGGAVAPQGPSAAGDERPNGPLQIVEVPPFVHLAKELSPSVVNISTSRTTDGLKMPKFRSPFQGPGGEDPFGEFYDKFFGDAPRAMRKQTSLGS
ncbi:MAG: hypothetical protein ACE5FC_01220, partial [Myxococcota bacterium]